MEEVERAMERVRKRTASAVGTPKVPSVKWEDVGGLEDVKRAILDTVELPLKHKELFARGLKRRSGVLLYGPPGTGKVMAGGGGEGWGGACERTLTWQDSNGRLL